MPQSRSAIFLRQVESFLKRSGMTPTRFGINVANDPALVPELRAGRQLREDLHDECLRYIAACDRRMQAKSNGSRASA
jgi:hypothetical protein